MDRRNFIKTSLGAAAAATLASCGVDSKNDNTNASRGGANKVGSGEMTMRTTPTTGDKVSLLGYGCMRLPTKSKTSAREDKQAEIDQDELNAHVDFAIAHGINYFDTSPVYCQGRSEHHMGIALSRHPRDKYFVSTKLSNFSPSLWSREESIKMYENSFKELQVDVIDYLLLHSVGGTASDDSGRKWDSMETLKGRYFDNGILDFLVEEKKKGKIRNLGFSYHGDVKIFDYMLQLHDEGKYKWDFVLIQMNYVDWKHAKEVNPNNTNASYLYEELAKRNIPVEVMEPLLGGRLASLPSFLSNKLKAERPEDSIAAWSFRHIGTHPNVLTVLSGMTYMENVKENIRTYSPLEPCPESEIRLLEDTIADMLLNFPAVPCTACQYCMPCPYGIDIPSIFTHYNNCLNEGNVSVNTMDPKFAEARRVFLMGYDRKISKLRQADHCIGCNKCKHHCPQGIDIPAQLTRIDSIVEELKRTLD